MAIDSALDTGPDSGSASDVDEHRCCGLDQMVPLWGGAARKGGEVEVEDCLLEEEVGEGGRVEEAEEGVVGVEEGEAGEEEAKEKPEEQVEEHVGRLVQRSSRQSACLVAGSCSGEIDSLHPLRPLLLSVRPIGPLFLVSIGPIGGSFPPPRISAGPYGLLPLSSRFPGVGRLPLLRSARYPLGHHGLAVAVPSAR